MERRLAHEEFDEPLIVDGNSKMIWQVLNPLESMRYIFVAASFFVHVPLPGRCFKNGSYRKSPPREPQEEWWRYCSPRLSDIVE